MKYNSNNETEPIEGKVTLDWKESSISEYFEYFILIKNGNIKEDMIREIQRNGLNEDMQPRL